MGCNTSQELKANKPDDVVEVAEKNETGKAITILNGDSSAGVRSPSVEDCSNAKDMPSLSQGINKKNYDSESEQNRECSQQKINPTVDITSRNKHNGLVNSDKYNAQYCDKANIAELSEIDSDDDDEDEAKAATKIQAAFRGHKVRVTMKKSECTPTVTAAPVTKNNPSDTMDTKSNTTGTENADPTKEELEAEFDPNDKELCDAALKIQATFRGHLSRKLAGQKAEDVDIQEITKKVAEELDIDLTDPELNKAATKIQASFRGHKSRKDLPAN